MDVLPIVKHLRDLSADPANRATIVKDQSCIQSLVLFLDNQNADVVKTSLEALKNLAQYPGNRVSMRSELGMLQSLRILVDKPEVSECSTLAENVYQLLLPATTTRAPVTAPPMGSFFKMGSVKNARTITLQIYGLTEPGCRKVLEEELLRVSGVVSFTFDLARYRCIVRCKAELKPALLCDAVANTGFLTAKQVVKTESGEETFIEFNATPAKATPDRKENALPDYLPEADDAEYPEHSNKAVQRTGQGSEQGSWFGSVGTFISKNLYW
ncbi:armadillo repeat-containing protein 1-like [Sycon ciliatum]|uniref:armadillo repeat-containing protein 1-like n=1 Tax=Sycon ciliatum TaxID=27933 RepID=UPI0020ADAEB3|eukprot:scpid89939/ scgid32209/ Armadillo repeat-containing protein 1